MAKKSKLPGLPVARFSWIVASGCLFPVVRLPVIWLPTSAKNGTK